MRGRSRQLGVAAVIALATSVACRARPAPPPPARSLATAIGTLARPRVVVDTAPPPAPFREPAFPYLRGEPHDETLSIGDTSHGRVVHATELTESDHVGILPKQKARDLAWGSAELVALLDRAGVELHDKTGSKLWVGDLGKRGGGDIAFSVSHNAGRDADVALAYLDASGARVDPPDLVPLGKDGWSKDKALQLDPERTWITVRALLAPSDARVEYVFVSDPLKKKILAWGRDHGGEPAILARATEVLRQPAGAAPHDDHLHVRTYCTARDLGAGCVDTGPPRPTTRADEATLRDRVRRAVEQLTADDPLDRARAVLRLALLGDAAHVKQIEKVLDDPSANARHAAAVALARVGGTSEVGVLAKRFAREGDPAVREQILFAATTLGGAESGKLLRAALESDEAAPDAAAPHSATPRPLELSLEVDLLDGASLSTPLPRRATSVRAFAVALAGRADRLEPVPALIALLSCPDDVLRAAAAESLALVTNHRFGETWGAGADSSACDAAKKRYEALWKRLEKSPRDAWIALGFTTAGFKVRALDKTSAWELVRATAGESHLSYNAREVLARIVDEPTSGALGPASDACAYYLRVFQERRRFHLDKPPPSTARACAGLQRG